MAYWIVRAVIRWLLLPAQMRLRVVGIARCPQRGPVVIVANHLGLLDPLMVATHVRRRVRIMAKAEVYGWPLVGWLARRCGIVPVRRGAADREALRTLGAVLAQGQCILVMAEGTYPKVPLPPALLPFKTGAAFLAIHSGATVLPVAVAGTERVWYPARGWRPWQRPRTTLSFGEPYRPELPPGMSTKAAYQAICDDMGHRVAALLPPAYRGYYADEDGN